MTASTGRQADLWDARPDRAAADALVVDVAGFEGPLDLLLSLARSQKVDLARISVLALAEQYLAFIQRTRDLRLELAGDYLVMAAWLAYLKSRLLLPEPAADDEPTGEEMAAQLAQRLRRLEAMRAAAARLMDRDRLGRDTFARGEPEMRIERRPAYHATLYDLLSAYAARRARRAEPRVRVGGRRVWSLAEGRAILSRLIGKLADWTPLSVLLAAAPEGGERRTATASTLGASLEMAREGRVEIRQHAAFAPVMIRSAASGSRPNG